MSRKNNKRYTKAQIEERIEAKKKAKRLAMQKHITIFTLLALLIIGLVSTTFASFTTPAQTGENGSLVAQIKTNAVNNGNKDHIAPVGADVDNAETGANTVAGGYVYFDNTKTKWADSHIQFVIGHNSFSRTYTMSKITNTNLYYVNLSSSTYHDWGDATYYAVIGASYKWGDGKWGSSNLTNATHRTAAYTTAYNMDSDTKRYLVTPTGSSNGTTIGIAYQGTTYSSLNKTNYVYVKSAAAGSTTYNDSNSAGTAKITGYYLSGNNAASSHSAETTLDSTSSANCTIAPATTITLEATANTGYKFVGWYTSTGTLVSTESSCTTAFAGGTTYHARFQKAGFSYTVSAGAGGSVSPTSGTASSVTITATPSTGYVFKNWTVTGAGSVTDANAASTTFNITGNGATATANFVPDKPQSIKLTAANTATDTSGTGTQSNPYIVYYNGGFKLTANATLVSEDADISAHYSTTENGTYSTTNSFNPNLDTKGTDQTFTVYAKAFANNLYSDDCVNATAHYMVFSHLDKTKTSFDVSSNTITNVETLTLSDAKIDGNDIADAEREYIDYTYQVSANGGTTYQDISGDTWSTETLGTYIFRVKVTNSKTGESVEGTNVKTVVVKQSEVNCTVTNDGSNSADVKVYADGTLVTGNKIAGNSQVKISITRPSNSYYIQYLKVNGTSVKDFENYNGDISDHIAVDQAKTDVTINYKLVEKPKVTIAKPNNSDSINFKYFVDGIESNVTVAGTYIVDYNKVITYSVTPSAGYYVQSMTGVTMGSATSGTATGTATVTSSISSVTAELVKNNTITVNVDTTSAVTTGGLISVDNSAYTFGEQIPLNYGVASTVVITPPENCYAVVSGNSVSATIGTDGKATFKVTLTGADKVYTVKFVENPKIYMVQPRYGSVYVTDDSDNYYFNGDSVGYGTKLTVHVKPDHANATLSNVFVNNASIGTTDGSTFVIKTDSTASADITIKSGHEFIDSTEYGMRRIFFTDNLRWGDNNVSVHYSNTSGDTDFSKNSVVMTYKFLNDASQRVYYADIPYSSKYVTFYNKSKTSQKTSQATITNEGNAFWNDNGTCKSWQENYSDYIATDRETTIQQGVTVKNEPVTFMYSCDFGDGVLSAKVVAGNAATFDFDEGVFSVTPTENTEAYTLVEVKSSASTTVKYYLIRVENFGISSFTGLQKIYDSAVLNNIQLSLIVEGGVLDYFAQYFISESNLSGTFKSLGLPVKIQKDDTLQSYINTFMINYEIGSMNGVRYYKGEATDGANRKASATQKTLFGTNSYKGERALYFYNDTTLNMSKYNLRACFMDVDSNNKTFVTMQRVGSTNYYRAVIPKNAGSKVYFYLCNPQTFSNNFTDYSSENAEIYSYKTIDGLNVPNADSTNIVFNFTGINGSAITGSFVDIN